MRYLPLFADLRGRPCLVVGGGPVGQRRVELLLEAGARVSLIAPTVTDALQRKADRGEIELERAPFEDQPLDGYWLVVAATDDAALNARIFARADAAQRLCNVADDPTHCSFILPALIDRDPITIAISTAGTSPVLARWIKGLIETLVPARIGSLAALFARWRQPVREAIREPRARRRFWEDLVARRAGSANLTASPEADDADMAAAVARWQQSDAARQGIAYLVGAGPGAADLITLRGRQLLSQADVVLYDRLVHPRLLSYARREAELISVGKTPGRPSMTQAQINRLLVHHVEAGKRVCRLKGGDPMVFGRAADELEALAAAGLRFEIVPGISAVEGCAAYAGIPLTARGLSRMILLATAHTADRAAADLDDFKPGQTLALYMGVAHYAEVGARLIAHGHDPATPAAIVENGTREDQRIVLTSLAELARASAEHAIQSPALLIVGDTAQLSARYAWFSTPIRGSVSEPERSLEPAGATPARIRQAV